MPGHRDVETLPPPLRDMLEHALAPGETLLWFGQPLVCYFKGRIFASLALLYIGFKFFILSNAIVRQDSRGLATRVLLGLALTLLVFGPQIYRLYQYRRRRRAAALVIYAITNERALILKHNPGAANTTLAFGVDSFPQVSVIHYPNSKAGNILFPGQHAAVDSMAKIDAHWNPHGFISVPAVDGVAELLHAVAVTQNPPAPEASQSPSPGGPFSSVDPILLQPPSVPH